MDFIAYETQLTRRVVLYGAFSALLAIMFIVCLFYVAHSPYFKADSDNPRDNRETKVTKWTLYILGLGGVVGCLVLGISTAWKCTYDINNQAYIVWQGDFSVYQDGPTKSRWYLPDDNGIKLEGDGLEEGQYTGRIVYSEKAKIVLDYTVDEYSEQQK